MTDRREASVAQKYEKQRQTMQETFSRQREQIKKDHEVNIGIDKFVSENCDYESELKKKSIGLVHFDEFVKLREKVESQESFAKRKADENRAKLELEDTRRKELEKSRRKKLEQSRLSFAADAEEEEAAQAESATASIPRPRKDPKVDTSFLPDKEREENERLERAQLKAEWLALQERIKSEPITVDYSYYDGSSQRKSLQCKKGTTIYQFLDMCRQSCVPLKGIPVENMMYIKEDVILPHNYTFYEFIINKVRGKTGPLFCFESKDDVRLTSDINVQTLESHTGKVVLKSWYEKHKHIYPASRWQVFDPLKHSASAGSSSRSA